MVAKIKQSKQAMLSIIYLLLILFFSTNVYGDKFEYKGDLFKDTNLTTHWSKFTKPPFLYENNNVLSIEAITTKEALLSLVPEHLKINEENKIFFFVGTFKLAHPNPYFYHEAGISIPVTYIDKETKEEKWANFIPILYLDEVNAIVGGREVYGYNKHYATFDIVEQDHKVHAKVDQYKNPLIEIEIIFDGQTNDKEISINHGGNIVLKRIPSIEFDGTLEVHKLNLNYLSDFKITNQKFGKGKLTLRGSEWERLNKIPILEITNASYVTTNMTLENGKTIHDYLN